MSVMGGLQIIARDHRSAFVSGTWRFAASPNHPSPNHAPNKGQQRRDYPAYNSQGHKFIHQYISLYDILMYVHQDI